MDDKYKSKATNPSSLLDNNSSMSQPCFYDDIHDCYSYHNPIDVFDGQLPPESVQKDGNVDHDMNNSDPWQSPSDSIQHTSQGYYAPYGFNPYINGTTSTSNQNKYCYPHLLPPGCHSYRYETPYWYRAPSTSQRNPTTSNSIFSSPFALIEQTGSHVLDGREALENLQDDDNALTSGTRSSCGTVMADEEFHIHRQVSPAPVGATDEHPGSDESSSSMGRKNLSTVANGYGVQAGNMGSVFPELARHIQNTRNEAFRTSGGDWEPFFQSCHESPTPASAQDDKEMGEADSMYEFQSSSVTTEIITEQLAQPLDASSIASIVDVGSFIRDALRPTTTTPTMAHPAHPMLPQAQAPTPNPITATAKFVEDTLHALTFEPYTNALGKKLYNWSNNPGWRVAVESLPEIAAGNRLDRLMGDHPLGNAIAQAMYDTIKDSAEEWIVRAVLGFGEGAMVLIEKV